MKKITFKNSLDVSIPYDLRYTDLELCKHYSCSICLEVCNLPRQCKEGHLICFECAQLQLMNSPTCPTCRCAISLETISRNLVAEKQIENLLVWCRYHFDLQGRNEWVVNEMGCNEAVPSINLAVHEKNCIFAWTLCPFSEKCKIRKKELQEHLKECKYRTTECEFCYGTIQLSEVNHHHLECVSVPIQCKYCGEKLKRGNIENHERIECLEFFVLCPYECKEKLKRKEIPQHNKDFIATHLEYMRIEIQQKHEIQLLEKDKKIEELNEKIECLNKKINYSSEGSLIQWRLDWNHIERERCVVEYFNFEKLDFSMCLYPHGDGIENSSGFISIYLFYEHRNTEREYSSFFNQKPQNRKKKEYVKKLKYYFELVNFQNPSANIVSRNLKCPLYPGSGDGQKPLKGERHFVENHKITRQTGLLSNDGEIMIKLHMDHVKTLIKI